MVDAWSFNNTVGSANDTAQHREVPQIVVDGVESDERHSHDDWSPIGSLSDRSSIAPTPPLSDTSEQEDDLYFEEPILNNLNSCNQDVQIGHEDDLDEFSSRSDYALALEYSWRDGELSRDYESSAVSEVSPQNSAQPATIQKRLIDSLQSRDHPENKRFFPNTAFTEIVNEQAVRKVLQHCYRSPNSDTIDDLVHTICGKEKSFRKVFTLLALLGKVVDIEKFLREGVSDNVLPLSTLSHPDSMIFQLGRVGPNGEVQPLNCVNNWNVSTMLMFEDWQWATLAPCFYKSERKNVCHVNIESRTPLPFISDSRYGLGSATIKGGYSTVFKVDIHPGHHKFIGSGCQGEEPSFAVKCLTTIDESRFDQEVDMLRRYTDNAHPHLVSLLATYKQLDKFYLIFPWADADLLSYWQDVNPTPTMDYDTVLWVAEQCHGIAEGLLAIHRHTTMRETHGREGDDIPDRQIQLYGRHGDIKSTNILWFRKDEKTIESSPKTSTLTRTNRGILKITDFGLAEFQESASMIYKSPSKVAVSAGYRSPECDMRDNTPSKGHVGVGPSHDIWALGCLYLEFITWLLGGWNLVEEFHKTRKAKEADADGKFFQIFIGVNGEPAAKIKESVTQFIDELHQHPNCTEHLHQFLDLIQTEMIIIKRKGPDLSRIGTRALNRKLQELLQRCKNVKFALDKVPRADRAGSPPASKSDEFGPLTQTRGRVRFSGTW